ncbi:MAG TPA: OmpA family protein [Kofleriaceae bacterium]|nr:OmpA family protein [Kofleriaceae bacterium]
MTRGLLAAVLLLPGAAAIAQPPGVCDERSQLTRDPDGDRLATVYFDTGSFRTDSAGREALRAAVDWQQEHPDRLLFVEGHTDRRGSWRANMALSQHRAESVRDLLASEGADPLRIVVAAYSDNEAVRTSAACNRRVVVRGTERRFPELVEEQREADLPRPAETSTPEQQPRQARGVPSASD